MASPTIEKGLHPRFNHSKHVKVMYMPRERMGNIGSMMEFESLKDRIMPDLDLLLARVLHRLLLS
jgi:hypothetical protein